MLDDITVTDPDAKYDVTAPTPSLRRTVRGGDKLTGVSPELLSHWNNLHDEFSAAGITPEIKSGFRTAAQQNALFKNPATAARTKGNDGYVNISPHQRGTALDISFNAAQRNQGRAIIANYAKRTGLHVPSDEPWHIALPQSKGTPVADLDSKYDVTPDATEPDTDPDAKYNVASAGTTATAPTPLTPNDVEWHFGTAGDPSKLTPRARKVLADAVAEDARKKSLYGGIEQPSADYQSTMRSRAGIGQRTAQPPQQPKPQPATTAATDAYGNPTPFGALRNIITAPDTARSTARAQIESERASEGTVARTIRTARSVLSPAAIDLLTASNPNTQLNDEVEKRVAAQQFHTTHADEIDNLASKYAYEIRGFSKQQVNKWLDEMSYRTKSALTSSVAGAVRPFSPDTYDKLRITAAAMAQAAENGGADRSTLSKFTQQTAAGFISSVPELTAMSLGVPASVVFGAGGALSEAGQGGSPTDIARESAVGATTGVLFETPMPGTSRLARMVQRAELVGVGSTAAELAAGHPLRESAISGVTNAVMAGAPELAGAHSYPDLFKRGPEGVVTGPTEIPAAYSADNAAAEQLLKTGAVKAGVTPESIAAATQASVPRTAPAIRQPLTTALYVPSTHDNGQISMVVEGADGGRTRKFFNSQAEADEFTAQRTGAPGQPTTAHGPPDLDPARFSDSERQTVEQILAHTSAMHDSTVLTKEGELVTTPIGLTPAKRGERGAIGEPPESGPKIPGVKVGAAADLEDAQDLGMVDSAPSTFNPQLSVRMADAFSHADQYAANLKEGRAQLDPLRQAVTAVHADFANAPQSEIVNWLTRNRPDLTSEYTDHEIAQAVRREYADRAESRALPTDVQDLGDIDTPLGLRESKRNERGALGEVPKTPKPALPGVKTGATIARIDNHIYPEIEDARGIWTTDPAYAKTPTAEETAAYHKSNRPNNAALSRMEKLVRANPWMLDELRKDSPEAAYRLEHGHWPEERVEHPTDTALSGERVATSPSGKTTYVRNEAGEIRAPRTTTVSQTPEQLQTGLDDIKRASRKIRSDYDAIVRHTARRQGLALANEDVTRNYFNRLRAFVRTNMPAKLDLVDQAESAAFSHQYAKATVLAESAFTGIHDYINKLGATNLALNYAIRSGDIDSLQRGPWKAALDEARKRLGETGPPISGGSVTFDPKVHPKGGYADHAKIAYIMEPFVDAARTEFARLVDAGKLKADQFTSYMRDWMQSTLETDDFKKWHRLNRDSAYGAVLNSVRSQVYDPALRGFKTVPNTASPYVDPTPLNFAIGATDRETARDIRREVSGDQNKQLAIGNTLAANGRRTVKDPTAQSAIYFYNAVGGDVAKLRSYLTNKDARLDPYRPALQKALNLSPAEMEWANKLRDAYDALGDYSRSLGTINHIRENYTNKLYVAEKPAKNFVQSDAYRSGLSKSTGHSKPVTYANALDAVLGLDANGNEVSATGKKLASTSAFDNFQILNSEMARANTNAKFREAMQRTGLGSEVPASHIPEGYTALEGMDRDIPIPTHESLTAPKGTFKWNQPNEDGAMVLHKRFVVPEGIAKGLAALTDADFAKRIGLLRKLDKYQGIVKTIDLSYSAFHHLALASQILYQSKYGFDLVRNARQLREWAKSGEMDKLEQDFTRHTGMTTRVESNQDILRDLTSGDDVLARAMNLPGIKQVAAGSKMSTDFLFDKIQRNLKVIDYANKSAKWIREHPKATDRELIEAKRSIASEINAAYGGLNWRALGVTRSQLSLLRLMLLSPDWTLSNGILLGKAVSGGPGGKAAKSHLITAAVGSALLTEGLSYALHGRSTTNNERGHEFELELSPGVYVSLFRGGISDIAKMYQLIHDVGPMRGVSQFASNKLAPLPRTAVGVISNYQLGRPILVPFNPSQSWMHNTYDQLIRTGSLLAPALPLPIGASQTAAYLRRGNATVAGTAAVASGLARSTSGKGARSPAEKYMAQLSDRKGHDIYDDAQDAHYTQRRGLIDAIRTQGVKTVAPQVRELAQQGKLGPEDVKTIRDDSKLTPFQERFKHINDLNDALNIWERMTPTEQHDTRAILGAKLQHTIPGKSAEEKQKILDHLRRIGLAPAAKVSANRVPVRAPNQSDLSYRASLKNYLHPSAEANRLAAMLNT